MPTQRIQQENENEPHFLTLTLIEWIDVFTKPEYFKIILDSLTFCRKNKGLLLYEYVIMSNHIHLIARAREGSKLSQIISDFKKHTTREILKMLEKDNRKYLLNTIRNSFSKKKGYENQIWQRENCPKLIATEEFLHQKIEYIHFNPVRKNYVDLPEYWLLSSAQNRLTEKSGIIAVDDYDSIVAPQSRQT